MRSFKSTVAAVALFAAVACFALALLAPASAAPEPSKAPIGRWLAVDGRALTPVAIDARTATDSSALHELAHPSGPFADADQPLQQVVAIGAMASAIRAPRPGPGALLMAGLIGVGAIAWRRAAHSPNQRLNASTVLR